MNDTFSEFVDYLTENMQYIKDSLVMDRGSESYKHYEKVFLENFHEYRAVGDFRGSVSATDSTEFVRELYSGKKIVLIRAYTRMGNDVTSKFLAEVLSVGRDDLSLFIGLLMEHYEHLSTMESLKTCKQDFALIDGSLVGRLIHDRGKLSASGYENFTELYFSTLEELFHISAEVEVPLVFVSKSSDSRVFTRYLQTLIGDSGRFGDETDHLLVRSIAQSHGYTTPIMMPMKIGATGRRINVVSFHAVPDTIDLPLKVDIFNGKKQEEIIESPIPVEVNREILSMIFWGYGGIKAHNIWLADVDRLVKFKTPEIENLYMKTFEKMTGIHFYETRGERRARIRI
ncbi:MAG: DNA double-strand break repair nuclease NurA [Thermoplasmataceae archaeon]